MTANEIRNKFLAFFSSKGHTIVASDSLVPKDDPTVLFTTAGMQQFKRQFLGYVDEYTRAASSQKCLRTDDLERVGRTDYHHTFFEMLGNFSFGDYFKKEAIAWAWEFLTQGLDIPAEKLWISVYKDDKEAKDIWLNGIKADAQKFIELDEHSNFWPADAQKNGPNGPCGPCSEIFFDYGINPDCPKKECDPSCECGRFSEVWNLVFTQFERKDGGALDPLPNKNIDTGMGLERLAAVVQGKKSNYETDLFAPIIEAIHDNIDTDGKTISETETFVIADHIRAIVFGIADGVIPSNEGRGYVLKRLIINITDIILQSGMKKPTIYKLVPAVIEAMQEPYPELINKADDVAGIIQNIEKSYIKVRSERLPELKRKAKDAKTAPTLGELFFIYRDTFGLTISTIKAAMSELGISGEKLEDAWKNFNQLMKQQQQQSRASSKMTGNVFTKADLELGLPKTEFLGYSHTQSTSTILKLFIDNQSVHEVHRGDHVKVVLDKTPFYAEAGGQLGDTGSLIKTKEMIRIGDTQKIDDILIHIGRVENGTFKINEPVQAEIDAQRRLSIMCNHTATHLLQAALRDVLGTHVKQQGSLVAEDRLRFDFTHHKAIEKKQIVQIEEHVNASIRACETVIKEHLPIEEAKQSGALAFFAEKYGKVVRIVSIGLNSKEFCGGTHLDSTGQIGLFKIIGESAIAQGIRRIEAKTGIGALAYINEQENQLDKAAVILKTSPSELVDRIAAQTKRLKTLEKDLEKFQFEAIKNSLDSILDNSENINGTKLVSHSFLDVEMNLLRKVADLLKQKSKSSIILLGGYTKDNASILIAVSDDLVEKGIKANEIIKDLAPLINGSGGGRPQLAQAGSKEVDKVENAIKQANRLIRERVKK